MSDRPLQIRLPARARLGEAAEVVVLTSEELTTTLASAVVRFDCTMIGPAGSRELWRTQIDLPERLTGPGARVSARLPRDLPPSYSGALARVAYRVTLHGEWIDEAGRERVVEEVKQLTVTPAPPRRPDRAGLRKSFHLIGGRRLEVELDSRRPALGQPVGGRVSVIGIAPARIREVRIALVAVEQVLSSGTVIASHELARVPAQPVRIEERDEWQPFELQVPDDFPATLRSRELRVESRLRFDVDLAWAFDGHADVPVTVDADRRVAEERATEVSSTSGSWTRLAAGTRFSESAGELVADIGPVRVRATVARRPRKPALLAAQLRYPSLRLDMRLEKDKFGRPALEVVRARDREQALIFSGALSAEAEHLDALTVDDERAYAAVEVTTELRRLVKPFLATVARLAGLVEGARRIVPPPVAMAECLGRWQSLARSLGGKLDIGPMAVSGQWQGMPVSVSTGWGPSGTPVSTEIRLRSAWSLGAGRHISTDADAAALPPPIAELATELLDGHHHLDIGPSDVVLVARPLTDQLSSVPDLLARMLELAHQLRSGPVYR